MKTKLIILLAIALLSISYRAFAQNETPENRWIERKANWYVYQLSFIQDEDYGEERKARIALDNKRLKEHMIEKAKKIGKGIDYVDQKISQAKIAWNNGITYGPRRKANR
ncbi:hypothetical protein KC901_02965 [Patescibacteria group bacterium]|nr:hypothetical protein [Patescibacteria group bacterium]